MKKVLNSLRHYGIAYGDLHSVHYRLQVTANQEPPLFFDQISRSTAVLFCQVHSFLSAPIFKDVLCRLGGKLRAISLS